MNVPTAENSSFASSPPSDTPTTERPIWAPELNPDGTVKTDYRDLDLPPGTQPALVPKLKAVCGTPGPGEFRSYAKTVTLSGEPQYLLPGGPVSLTQSSEVFCGDLGMKEEIFNHGGCLVEIRDDPETGESKLVRVNQSGLRTRIELLGPLYEYRRRGSSHHLEEGALCSEEVAKGIINSRAAQTLPKRISLVVNCPIICFGNKQDEALNVLAKGYHPLLGGVYITKGLVPPEVPEKEAIRAIARVFEDGNYLTECDRSRAWAGPVTIALKLGGILKAHVPIQYAGAPGIDCGKTYLQELTAAFFGELPYVPTVRKQGVGGVEESMAQGMFSGRLFIKVDNVKGEFDSQFLAAAVCHDRIPVRIPYAREIEVDPGRHVFMINSYSAEISADLIRRFSIVRLWKRKISFAYNRYREGDRDVLSHVRANQAYYLGCVFAIVRAWVAAGRPRTRERRHSFTEWAQSLDWIIRNIFRSNAGLFDDYDDNGQPKEIPWPSEPARVGSFLSS